MENGANMIQEEKELLLRDLCARLPYGVKVQVADCKTPVELSHIDTKNGNGRKPYCFVFAFEPERVKPYLRPMSSMTEEEKRELSKKYVWDISCGQIEIRYHSDGYWDDDTKCPTSEYLRLFDWLNAHHFDYRGLIDKDLALKAPERMYNEIK